MIPVFKKKNYFISGCVQFVFSIVEQAPRDPVERKPTATSLLKSSLKSPKPATVVKIEDLSPSTSTEFNPGYH